MMNTQSTTSLPTDAEAIARIEREPLPERLVGDINRVEFDAAYWEKQANMMRRQRDKAERERDELLEASEAAYTMLGAIGHEWPGRATVEGQHLLSQLRDAIANATGREAMDVQDDYCNRAAIRKATTGAPHATP